MFTRTLQKLATEAGQQPEELLSWPLTAVNALLSSHSFSIEETAEARRNWSELCEERSADTLETVIKAFLSSRKGGNVFATSQEHQQMLLQMQQFLASVAPANAPMCGPVPFKPLFATEADVARHVQKRERRSDLTALLCNSGNARSGKTVSLLHATVVGVNMLHGMIDGCSEDTSSRHRFRAMGFYVTFNRYTTGYSNEFETKDGYQRPIPVLTAIALRMVYALRDTACSTDWDFATFSIRAMRQCNLESDMTNFTDIVTVLRKLLVWDGPMFIAIDEFVEPYARYAMQGSAVVSGLQTVCAHLLDEAHLLDFWGKVTEVYERYIAVSVFNTIDVVALATKRSGRPIIPMTMPCLSVQDIAELFTRYKPSYPDHYLLILGPERKDVRLGPEQLVFLIDLSLATGHHRSIVTCLAGHATDKLGEIFYRPTQQALASLFWTNRIDVSPSLREPTEAMCLRACELVAGATTMSIFSLTENDDCRAFAADAKLASDCTVTQSEPTRLLVSPRFLRALERHWCAALSLFLRTHVGVVADALERHTSLAVAVATAAAELVARPPSPLVSEITSLWTASNGVAFEELTFAALVLYVACRLQSRTTTCRDLLSPICSWIGEESRDFDEVKLAGGPLVLIDGILNFPTMFMDVYFASDDVVTTAEIEKQRSRVEALFGESEVLDAAARRFFRRCPRHERRSIPPSGSSCQQRARPLLLQAKQCKQPRGGRGDLSSRGEGMLLPARPAP